MSYKKLKLFSGLLSVTALASMTAAPVLANEPVQPGLSMTGMTDESASGTDAAGESASQVSGSGLMSDMAVSAGNTAEDLAALDISVGADADGAEAAVAEAEVEEEASINSEVLEVLAAPFADPDQDMTAEEYNEAVLPEFSVALNKPVPTIDFSAETAISSMDYEKKPEAADEKLVVASPNVYLNIHENPSLGSSVLGKMYGNDVAIALRKVDDRWTKVRSGNVVGYALNDYRSSPRRRMETSTK